MRTLYDKLGVPRHASAADIERSYRDALGVHLAGNRGRPLRMKDQRRLQQVRQAYLVLASPARRSEYDLKLGRLEQARLRTIERIGTVVCVMLMVAGLAMIARSYVEQVYDGEPAAPTALTHDVTGSKQGYTVVTAEGRSAIPAAHLHAD